MQLSYNGVKLLQVFEGFSETAYQDSAGIWTIGYGSTHVDGVAVQEGDTITPEKAEQQMFLDTAGAQTCINQNVEVPLRQNQFDALVCFVYNIGCGAFLKSTLLKLLNLRLYDLAAKEFPRWNRAGGREIKGLTNRRLQEMAVFQS
jgi:lysozyme